MDEDAIGLFEHCSHYMLVQALWTNAVGRLRRKETLPVGGEGDNIAGARIPDQRHRAPPGELFSETNDNPVAILLTYGTARVLLAGNTEARKEEYMAIGLCTRP